ncbi:MAG: cyclase family protein [Candidatus Thorarchaeota archaeon]
MKFVDLSIPIKNNWPCDPPLMYPEIEYNDHERGALEMGFFFPDLIPEKELPLGKGWATENVRLSTHNGTHMDAPWHYAPVMDKEIAEKPAMTIDEIPLEWCMAPLVILDCTDLEDGYIMQPEDIDQKLAELNYTLNHGDVLSIHTNAPNYIGTDEYINHGVGVGLEGTLHILRQGIKIVGTDAWSWDAPFALTSEKWQKGLKEDIRDPSIIWEGHFAGIKRGYFQMEKLTNLEQVPPVGATICCFPIKIAKASAAWVRAVAYFD